MEKFKTNHKVDLFLSKTKIWKEEFKESRRIILECGLTEELKWGQPCYTFNGANIIILGGFKAYFGILFVKGALLKDPKKILIQQTENVQSGRQIRFTNVDEIINQELILKSYIKEAIEVEKMGLKVEMKKVTDFKIPEELEKEFNKNSKLKTAFTSLTPGRQRAYILYFTGAKQSKTREVRIDKYIPQILNGKGLND